MIPVIVPDHLPLHTALRAAAARGQVLQTNGKCSCIADRLLPGYARITGGGPVDPTPNEKDAA